MWARGIEGIKLEAQSFLFYSYITCLQCDGMDPFTQVEVLNFILFISKEGGHKSNIEKL